MIDAHIIPAIGRYKLKDLRTHHIQALLNKQIADGHQRTAENIKLTIKQILAQAVKNDLIYKNVADNIALPKKEKPQKRALSEKEKQYISNADFSLKEKAFVNVLLYTGVRRGEILALTKGDVNFKESTLSINKALIFKGNTPEIKNCPKSDAGNRTIPIPSDLLTLLIEYCSQLNSLILFPSARGELMSKIAFRRFWDKITDVINITAGGKNTNPKIIAIANDITPLLFRHTYATMLYYAGVDIKTAQYLLGHSTVQMTLDIYSHVT